MFELLSHGRPEHSGQTQAWVRVKTYRLKLNEGIHEARGHSGALELSTFWRTSPPEMKAANRLVMSRLKRWNLVLRCHKAKDAEVKIRLLSVLSLLKLQQSPY